jgi:hypothetical protein
MHASREVAVAALGRSSSRSAIRPDFRGFLLKRFTGAIARIIARWASTCSLDTSGRRAPYPAADL